MKKLLFCISFILVTMLISAQRLTVPGEYSTIQAAIDAATDGDTVLVDEGTYYENINFKGKSITVASNYLFDEKESTRANTIIDGSQPDDPDKGSVVTMNSGEDSTSVLCGFTITGGSGNRVDDLWNNKTIAGGGILMDGAGGKVVSNHIIDNHLGLNSASNVDFHLGAGIASLRSGLKEVIIRNNIIEKDSITTTKYGYGAGIYLGVGSEGKIDNNTIAYNKSSAGSIAWGGGIHVMQYSSDQDYPIYITNNEIYENSAISTDNGKGGGLFLSDCNDTTIILSNNIVYNNYAKHVGGGVYILYGTICWMYNNTLHNNYTDGRANNLCLDMNSEVRMYNNILSSDVDNDVPDFHIFNTGNTVHSINNMLAEDLTPDAQLFELANLISDPLYADDQFNLSDTSPAVGRGLDSVLIEDTWMHGAKYDVNGVNRKLASTDQRPDMGAVESSYDRIDPDYNTATVIRVPDEQPTIQAGIDAAADGDTVMVLEGRYFENINFKGKPVTVASAYILEEDEMFIERTTIDGSKPLDTDSASVVMMVSGEDTTSILKGFTITGGSGTTEDAGGGGGGVQMYFSGGIIEHNIIENNHVKFDGASGWGLGGGISASTNNDRIAIIRYNTIAENTINSAVYANGGGISLGGSNFVIEHNKIYKNMCNAQSNVSYGGGIGWWSFDPPGYNPNVKIRYNEIYSNRVESEMADQHTTGGGIRLISTVSESDVDVYNNLIYDNISDGSGGGIAFYGTNDAVCRNNTIYDNRVDSNGKSIYQNGGSVIFFNNIVWTRLLKKDEIVLYNNAGNPKFHAHFNLVKGGWEGNSNFIGDPDLMNDSFELLESSLCIDRGAESVEVNGVTYFAPSMDMDGNIRPFAGNDVAGVDLGALESEFSRVDHFEMITEQLDNGGSCKVTLSIFAEGGVPPYTYYIDDVEQSGNIIENLCSGEYIVTIIDALGNEVEDTVVLVGINENIVDNGDLKIYPNPSSTMTTIKFDLEEQLPVHLSIFNLLGQEQIVLLSEDRFAGQHEVQFDATQLNSGVYFVRLVTDKLSTSKLIVQ